MFIVDRRLSNNITCARNLYVTYANPASDVNKFSKTLKSSRNTRYSMSESVSPHQMVGSFESESRDGGFEALAVPDDQLPVHSNSGKL